MDLLHLVEVHVVVFSLVKLLGQRTHPIPRPVYHLDVLASVAAYRWDQYAIIWRRSLYTLEGYTQGSAECCPILWGQHVSAGQAKRSEGR